MVVSCGAAIDDDIRDAALRRHQWKGGGRINGQSRTERYHKVRLHRRLLGLFEDLWIEALSETDRRRFQESAAIA